MAYSLHTDCLTCVDVNNGLLIFILYSFRSPNTVLNLSVNGKIQDLFKTFECFSSTFQGKFKAMDC